MTGVRGIHGPDKKFAMTTLTCVGAWGLCVRCMDHRHLSLYSFILLVWPRDFGQKNPLS